MHKNRDLMIIILPVSRASAFPFLRKKDGTHGNWTLKRMCVYVCVCVFLHEVSAISPY